MTLMSRVLVISALLVLAACNEPIIIAPDAILPDGSVYEGDIRDGKFNGEGTLKFKVGGYYKGGFADGVFHGHGLLVDHTDVRIEGNFVEGRMFGIFTATYPADGSTYEGEMQDWYFNGQGKYTTEEYSHEGGYKAGLFEGFGRIEYQDGSIYEGEFKAGEYHGQGEFFDTDGGHYVGQFKADKYHGNGRYTHGETYYEGTFVDGELSGEGEYQDAEKAKYSGEIDGWFANGKGELVDADGNIFKGQFESGYINGEGEMIGANGSHYKGGFQYGQFNGQGMKTNDDKSVYEGEFFYGQYHGQGKLTKPAEGDSPETVLSGQWQRGSLVHNDASGERYHSQAEVALENHQRLLDKSLQHLQVGDPNKAEVYFLGVAGDGSQSVFRRELEYVEAQIKARYNNAGRNLRLINHHDSANTYPLATNRSISSAIDAISQKMNPEQDVLFMYLSSHGSKDHEFYLNHDSIRLPTLPSVSLAEMLAESKIKWKVIMVSACYSGGFIEPLADDTTIVITASDSASTSFGCSEESDMTYFGKAFFKEVLAVQPELSLTDAFKKAKGIVKQWEEEQELSSSNPTISAPTAIVEKLAGMRVTSH